jgi:hypothetical protein
MNYELTQNKSIFSAYNTPKCDLDYIGDNELLFPTELRFGKKYYKVGSGNKLIAFKILAYAVYSTHKYYKEMGLSFLVQLPNSEEPQWIENFIKQDTTIFESKEAFFEHQVNGNCSIDLEWRIGRTAFTNLARAAVIGFYGKCWYWNTTTNRPQNDFYPRFEHLLVTKEGMKVYITKSGCGYKDVFLSQAECVKNKLNGMVIEDFEDEEELTINIKVTTSKAKVHTLHFVEE